MKILICGLPGSGKTWLAKRLHERFKGSMWYNADVIRETFNDWDFSPEGRLRQATRMKTLADADYKHGKIVICDFVAPTEEIRSLFNADKTIWMNTIQEGRFEDTNKVFIAPTKYDIVIDKFLSDEEIEDLVL
jgi:adenylylsulfate kinase